MTQSFSDSVRAGCRNWRGPLGRGSPFPTASALEIQCRFQTALVLDLRGGRGRPCLFAETLEYSIQCVLVIPLLAFPTSDCT